MTSVKVLPLFLACLVCACQEKVALRDVSHEHANNPFLNDSYVVGGIYQTQMPFIATKDGALVEPGGPMPFIKDVKKNPKKYKNVAGIIPTGTTLQISRLVLHPQFGVNAYGIILEGNLERTELYLSGVSGFKHDTPVGSMGIPDPTRLKFIEGPAQEPEDESD